MIYDHIRFSDILATNYNDFGTFKKYILFVMKKSRDISSRADPKTPSVYECLEFYRMRDIVSNKTSMLKVLT